MFAIPGSVKVGAACLLVGLALGFKAGWQVNGWRLEAATAKDWSNAYSNSVARWSKEARLAEASNLTLSTKLAALEGENSRLRRNNRAPLPIAYKPAVDVDGVASCPDPRGPEWLRRYQEAATTGSRVTAAGGVH